MSVALAEALETIKKVIVEATKEVKLETPMTPEEREIARSLLSAFLEHFWTSTLGQKLKRELSAAASDYASYLEDIAKELKLGEKYQKAAEVTALGSKYRLVWGKPPKKKEGKE
jgi:hypothetical protein